MFPYNNSCHFVGLDLLLFSLFSDHKGKKKMKYYSELAKLFTSGSESSIMTAKIITMAGLQCHAIKNKNHSHSMN